MAGTKINKSGQQLVSYQSLDLDMRVGRKGGHPLEERESLVPELALDDGLLQLFGFLLERHKLCPQGCVLALQVAGTTGHLVFAGFAVVPRLLGSVVVPFSSFEIFVVFLLDRDGFLLGTGTSG